MFPTNLRWTQNRYSIWDCSCRFSADSLSHAQELPMSQHPEVFGMHENVDISKELQETREVLLTTFSSQCEQKLVLKVGHLLSRKTIHDFPFLYVQMQLRSVGLCVSACVCFSCSFVTLSWKFSPRREAEAAARKLMTFSTRLLWISCQR